jgi:hypothetical protein
MSIQEDFSGLEDPRIEPNELHELMDIVIPVICAIVSGADGWEAIEEFGKEKLAWLRRSAPFGNGVPSHDCIANVMSQLSVQGVHECFMGWTGAAMEATGAR